LVGPSPYLTQTAPYTLGDFATKIHPAGCAILYSTSLPNVASSGSTIPVGIAVDSSGAAYVVEKAQINTSYGGANEVNPIQTPTLGTAIVGKVNPAGTSFPFWTTLGGSGSDSPNAVATDSQGNIYVAGQTSSPDFPTTPGTFQPDCPACGSYVGIGSKHLAVGGFVTKISPGSLTGVVLTRSELTFAPATTGLTSAGQAEAVGLLNSLTAPLTISSVTVSGSAFSLSSSVQTTCTGTLAPGAGCSVYVRFQPTIYGAQTGTLTITDSGPGSPRRIGLNGSGTADFQMITPANRATLMRGTDTAQFTIYVSEISGAPAQSGNVALTCTAASPANCTFNPIFAPVNGGNSVLTVSGLSSVSGSTLNFSAIGSFSGQTTTLPLSIQIQDFSLAAPQSSATVSPGQSATYSLSIAPSGGFNQSVGFVCGNAPAGTTCTVSPSSVTLDGSNSVTSKITVTTTAPSFSPPMGHRPMSPLGINFKVPSAWLLVLAVLMAFLAAASRRRRPAWLGLAVLVLLAGVWVSCGGGSASPPGGGGGGNPGTTPGVYTLTVTGTYSSTGGNLSHSVNLTLTVQ
jgi:beta-propeller repeat-containing protein